MSTPLPVEGKVLSSYKEVSRTFTYGIYATLPLFIIYQIGIPFINAGKKYQIVNGADNILEQISTLWGTLPSSTTGLLLVMGMIAMLYYERKHLGFIHSRISFFFLTLPESIFFALTIGFIASWLATLVLLILHPNLSPSAFGHLPEPIMVTIVQGAGAGFYEELFFRVILLGGALALFRLMRIPGMIARIIAVTVVSMIFSAPHYMGPLGEHYDLTSFLYRAYLGVLLSAIYLRRGFATAAWTHALFDIFVFL